MRQYNTIQKNTPEYLEVPTGMKTGMFQWGYSVYLSHKFSLLKQGVYSLAKKFVSPYTPEVYPKKTNDTTHWDDLMDRLVVVNLRTLGDAYMFHSFGSHETSLPISLSQVLVDTGLCPSKKRARDDIKNGAIKVNLKVESSDRPLTVDDLRISCYYILVQRGKKLETKLIEIK